MSEQILAVQALEEAVELLQEENNRLRNNNRILRIVNSGLRSKLEIAQKNDEEFQSLCQYEFEAEPYEVKTSWGSYPASVADATGTSYEVEPLDEQEYSINVGGGVLKGRLYPPTTEVEPLIDVEALNQQKSSY
jgi:hypothetical protein